MVGGRRQYTKLLMIYMYCLCVFCVYDVSIIILCVCLLKIHSMLISMCVCTYSPTLY